MSKKPLIGITPKIISNEESCLMILSGYTESILKSGGIGCVLPFTNDISVIKEIVNTFDGFLFSGGCDIEPKLYGEKPTPFLKEISKERDEFETLLLNELIKTNKPVLGICRGMQIMNVTLGGTLHQDIVSQNASQTPHYMNKPYDKPFHNVKVNPETFLYNIINESIIGVNSRHHQAIKKISPCLLPMAFSDDGILEAVYNPDKPFFIGVQWHPEDLYENFEHSKKLFKAFIEAAKKDL